MLIGVFVPMPISPMALVVVALLIVAFVVWVVVKGRK